MYMCTHVHIYPVYTYIQLTLEQWEFEFHRSTYMWIFFNNKYYSTKCLWLVESGNMEEMCI